MYKFQNIALMQQLFHRCNKWCIRAIYTEFCCIFAYFKLQLSDFDVLANFAMQQWLDRCFFWCNFAPDKTTKANTKWRKRFSAIYLLPHCLCRESGHQVRMSPPANESQSPASHQSLWYSPAANKKRKRIFSIFRKMERWSAEKPKRRVSKNRLNI